MRIKKHILSALALVLSLLLVFSFTACGDDKTPAITAISMSSAALEVETGDTARLTVTATYKDESEVELKAGDVTWASDNPSVASVTRGVVSGKAKGTAKITATYGDFSATCSITVNSVEVKISGYTPNADGKIELDVDGTLNLSAKVLKNDVEMENEQIVWTTSNRGIVSVNNGVITGVNPGEAVITVKRVSNESQSASVTVVIKEIAGAELMDTYEQNKTPADTWGYWGDQGYNWSNTTIYSAYTEPYNEESPSDGYKYIGANKMNVTFSVDKYAGSVQPGPKDSAIQLFYRSSTGNKGKLEANHNYEIKFKILSNAAGTIVVNPYDDNDTGYHMDEDNEDNHKAELVANEEKEITVEFRHGDSGAIYANGVYDNVETAVNILLGLLSEPNDGEGTGNVVKVSIYDIQFKDLGESTHKWIDDETKLEGYVDPDAPVIPDAPEALAADVAVATGVTLTVEDGKAIFNLAGTVKLDAFENVDAAKAWLNATPFDLQECGGGWKKWEFTRVSVSVNEEDSTFLIKYDITRLTVDATSDNSTGAYNAHFTEKLPDEEGYSDNKLRDLKLSAESAVHGSSVTVGDKKYSIVNYQAGVDFEGTAENNWGQAYNYGCVSIKVENVTAE